MLDTVRSEPGKKAVIDQKTADNPGRITVLACHVAREREPGPGDVENLVRSAMGTIPLRAQGQSRRAGVDGDRVTKIVTISDSTYGIAPAILPAREHRCTIGITVGRRDKE